MSEQEKQFSAEEQREFIRNIHLYTGPDPAKFWEAVHLGAGEKVQQMAATNHKQLAEGVQAHTKSLLAIIQQQSEELTIYREFECLLMGDESYVAADYSSFHKRLYELRCKVAGVWDPEV